MTRYRLPAHVEQALCEVFGPAAQEVRIVPNSWYARLHGRAVATTRRNRILLRGSLDTFAADPELLLHEYFHVLEQWRTRRLSIWRYLLESFKNGYWRNRFEIEARQFTALHQARFSALLAATAAPSPEHGLASPMPRRPGDETRG